MKVLSHGLNRYDGYHNIYFSAALNREPRHLAFLRDLGFDLAHVHEATTHEVIYQSVMRTSLRCPDVTNPVTIVVPDSHAAYRLKDLIGATNVTKLGNIERPKPRLLTATERNNRSKVTKHTQRPFCGEIVTKHVNRHKMSPYRRRRSRSDIIPESPYLLRDISPKQICQSSR